MANRCKWCGSFYIGAGERCCSVCISKSVGTCVRCKISFPSESHFKLCKTRCNSCQKTYLREKSKRKEKHSCWVENQLPAHRLTLITPPASPDHESGDMAHSAATGVNTGEEDSPPFDSFPEDEMGAMAGGKNDDDDTEEDIDLSSPETDLAGVKEASRANNKRKSTKRKINKYFDTDEDEASPSPPSREIESEFELAEPPKETALSGKKRKEQTLDELIGAVVNEKKKKKAASPPPSPSLLSGRPLDGKKKAEKKTKKKRQTQQQKLIDREEEMLRYCIDYLKASNPKFKGPLFQVGFNPSLQNGK